MQDNNPNTEPWWRPAAALFSKVSTWVVVPIILALVVGKYLDQRFGTDPWLFLALAGLGFLVSSFGIWKEVQGYLKDIDKNNGDK
jgi:F0F1-type ATP synthase assembly protein I